MSVVLFSAAAFLAVLALLATQLRTADAPRGPHRVVVLRRVYQTTIVETIGSGSSGGGTSVTQSVSNSGSGYSQSAAPTTRSS
jgi:hypothetical protein